MPQVRLMRLSEGVCPACDEPLARGREDGICNCCGWTWRMRDSQIEGRRDSDWLPDLDTPRGCLGGGELTLGTGAVMTMERSHVFHLKASDHDTTTTGEDDG
jgi:hypothetical protein